jgi:hypothetical protein
MLTNRELKRMQRARQKEARKQKRERIAMDREYAKNKPHHDWGMEDVLRNHGLL